MKLLLCALAMLAVVWTTDVILPQFGLRIPRYPGLKPLARLLNIGNAVVLCALVLAGGCVSSYRQFKTDPLGLQAKRNEAYWEGWRVGYREGLSATDEARRRIGR